VFQAQLKLIATPGVTGAIDELSARFAAMTGHNFVINYDVVAVLKRRIDAGEAFDVAILSPEAVNDLMHSGRMVGDSLANIGRSGMAVAARKGATKPDVSSTEAFKNAMLNARLVSYSKEGLSGVHFLAALDRLGIVEGMRPRIRSYENVGMATAVANGEAELVVTGFGALLAEPGIEIVGALPPELQAYVYFTAGISAKAKEPQAAKSFIQFLTAPGAGPVLKAKGLEPSRG
jgi:molybdate transport system substrate-binding protein